MPHWNRSGSLTLITKPALEPITLAKAKAHLRVEDTEGSPLDSHPDDALITTLITAVRQHLDGRDGWLGRQLVPATWELSLDAFPIEDFIWLRLPPIISVVSVTYLDPDGVEQTFASSNYTLSADKHYNPKIHLKPDASWPSTEDVPDAVKVQTINGYEGGSPEDGGGVPDPIKAGMLLTIGHLYQQREAVVVGTGAVMLPLGAEALLLPYRVGWF